MIKGKVVLITGASSGIGRALALQLAEQGAFLALAARRVARLEGLSKEILEKFEVPPPLVLPTDLKRDGDVASMLKKTHDHYGRIDVLVNNAGLLYLEPFAGQPAARMRELFDVNFWPVVQALQEAVPYLGKQGGGHIINVGSAVSRRALPYLAAYSASKWALAGLTEAVRLELASSNIKLTMVYPGGVSTEMPQNADRSRLPPSYPKNRGRSQITAERAARAVVSAIRRPRLEVYVPWWIRIGAWLSVVWPAAADVLVKKIQRIR